MWLFKLLNISHKKMELLKENKVYLYAEYKIGDKIKCQVIPSGEISDLIYEDGMDDVCFKNIIQIQGVLIDCTQKEADHYSIGTLVTRDEIQKIIESNDSQLEEDDTTKNNILYLIRDMNPKNNFIIDPRKRFRPIPPYPKAIMPKLNGEPIYINQSDIIKGDNCWYIELYNDDGIQYERTFLGDKKYRGQRCKDYSFVLICEYQINGEKKYAVVHREDIKYPYEDYKPDKIDPIIDEAKKLVITSEYKFDGFSGVTPLYRHNTEDSSSVFKDSESLINGQNVVTVTGSGDAVLDLFLNGANKVVSFDINSMAVFWAELKFVAAKYLSYKDFMELVETPNFEIYNKIRDYMTPETRRVWDELFSFCSLRKINFGSKQSHLIYNVDSFFVADYSVENQYGYCNEHNYHKLQEILKTKSITDVSFVTCDIYELPKKVNLKDYSYAYLSNIMDFLVGISEYRVDENALEKFKQYVLKELLPSMRENANIDLSYISNNWHLGTDSQRVYDSKFPKEEGFCQTRLPKGNARVLSYRTMLLTNPNRIETQKLGREVLNELQDGSFLHSLKAEMLRQIEKITYNEVGVKND